MKSTFLWRNRVLLTSGLLLILSLHLISTGVHPGDLAARPQSAFLAVISPITGAFTHLSDGASSITRDYLDLVHVRDENAHLRNELAKVKSDQARLAELEVENQHLARAARTQGRTRHQRSRRQRDRQRRQRHLAHPGSQSRVRTTDFSPGMAVLANQGVVGKIIAVSPNASRVLLIDDHNSALDGFDQRSRARGIVAGHGR